MVFDIFLPEIGYKVLISLIKKFSEVVLRWYHFFPLMYLENLPLFKYCRQLDISGDYNQEIMQSLKFGRPLMKELEKITKSKDVSLETKSELIHALTFSITIYSDEG